MPYEDFDPIITLSLGSPFRSYDILLDNRLKGFYVEDSNMEGVNFIAGKNLLL